MHRKDNSIKSPIAARFSSAASTYHQLAWIQRRVAERLMELLIPDGMPARILEIGCGTGVLTEILSRAFPASKIDAVDISAAMTVRARTNLAGNKMINWIVADARQLPESIKYPLIASNCAIHWIAPLDLLISKLSALLEHNGRLALALMVRGTLTELNATRNRIAPHKSPRLELPDEQHVRLAIDKAHFKLCAEKSETIRQEYPSAPEMLRQLHDLGLTGGNSMPGNDLLTRSELSRLISDYAGHYKSQDGVYASYRVLYCLAMKTADGNHV